MAGHNLPEQMAKEADWEYEELNLTGGTTKIDVTKSGVLPVVITSGTNVIQLSDPTRAGVELTVVIARRISGTSGVTSATGNIGFKEQDWSISYSSQAYMANSNGFAREFKSVPVYVSGVRTYRWLTQDAIP